MRIFWCWEWGLYSAPGDREKRPWPITMDRRVVLCLSSELGGALLWCENCMNIHLQVNICLLQNH